MYKGLTTDAHSASKGLSQVNRLYRKIKKQFKWLIYCDVDEFIATKKNFDLTIRSQLKQIDSLKVNIKQIFVPWVLMSGKKLKNNPKSVLKEVLYRHDHDKRHPIPFPFKKNPRSRRKFRCRKRLIEGKSILKPKYWRSLRDHHPILPNRNASPRAITVNSISLRHDGRIVGKTGSAKFLKLRNKDIENGFFVCYHYRYISEAHSRSKLKTNGWYEADGYSFGVLKATTYPEIYDDTMLKKVSCSGEK